jgi:hypothetical protein
MHTLGCSNKTQREWTDGQTFEGENLLAVETHLAERNCSYIANSFYIPRCLRAAAGHGPHVINFAGLRMK